MIDVLTTINIELSELNIPYAYNTWDCEIELPKFIGEISEVTNPNEDGMSEFSLTLTGFGHTFSELFEYAEKLKKRFKFSQTINGIVIRYENMIPGKEFLSTGGSEDFKQIQVNLNIKKWSV